MSDTLSPACIGTGSPPPDFNKIRIELGAYAQVFEDNNPSNTVRARSLGAIAFTPTDNAHGDYIFMSLVSGKKISRHQWTKFPMIETAIVRVEALAAHKGQRLLSKDGPLAEWRPNMPINDDEYDVNYELPRADPADTFEAGHFDPLDADELADLASRRRPRLT